MPDVAVNEPGVGGVGQVLPTVVPTEVPSKKIVDEPTPNANTATVVPCGPDVGEITKKVPEDVIEMRTVTAVVPSLTVIV